MRIVLGLCLFFAIFAASPASAQGTPRQRTACTDDAYKFCENLVPNQIAVEQCLRANISGLSRACRKELAGAARAAKKKHGRHD